MNMIKEYFATIDELKTESKKVIFLEVVCAALLGLVIGMMLSPKKHVAIGSNNRGNGCNNQSSKDNRDYGCCDGDCDCNCDCEEDDDLDD